MSTPLYIVYKLYKALYTCFRCVRLAMVLNSLYMYIYIIDLIGKQIPRLSIIIDFSNIKKSNIKNLFNYINDVISKC